MASNCATKPQLEEKLRYAKSKTKWYQDENHELKRKIKQLEGQLSAKNEKISKVIAGSDEKVAKYKGIAHEANYKASYVKRDARSVREERKELKQELNKVMKSVAFLDNDLSWDDETSKERQVEIIIRAIVAYTQLISDEVITYSEFMFLLLGSQREYFSMEDIKDRLGSLGRYHKFEFGKCYEAGYFKKVHRKQLWYMVPVGEDRLTAILKHVYTIKIGTYKEVKRVLEKI